ncbi:MAG: helicase [Candidatus Lokiarchaeota archaeon]|nr:helicase [Candidatus Lokiarchaeota archaeon]
MNMQEILSYISRIDYIPLEKSFALSKMCSQLLGDEKTESRGREFVIRMLDVWEKIEPKTHDIWNDLVEAAGLHLYVEYKKLSGSSCIRHEYFRSKYLPNIYFHEEQMQLLHILNSDNSLILSAPTSFGKSLLIEEIIASKRYNNIVIIQPTLALLDETRKKLNKYRKYYDIVVNTSHISKRENVIFLFTGERVVEYQNFPKIDFFIIDEFYKLSISRDDERAPILNLALYKLKKMTDKFYMLGPNIKSIPSGFTEKYKSKWHRTNFSTVAINVKDVTEEQKIKKKEKENKLFELLTKLHEPTLIYCSSPGKANDLVSKFIKFINEKGNTKNSNNSDIKDLIQWIDVNIHRKWILRKALEYNIGIHHGALPRHISSSIVDLFNESSINYLFCTSTLIEGVNTSAKNVVLFDKKKGPKFIDYFDFQNIIGRSGRMYKHFIGHVYKFYPEPEQLELNVDIPVFTQTKAPLELLIQIEEKDLKTKSKEKLETFKQQNKEIQNLLKRNAGVQIEGQLEIIRMLQKKFNYYYPLISWTGIPNFEQLFTVVTLGWNYFLKESESRGGVYSAKQLTFLILKYCKLKSSKGLIESMFSSKYWSDKILDEDERLQKVIHSVFQIIRHWFDYKLPKLLNVLSEIQRYICEMKNKTPGDYTVLANLVENDFLPKHLSILLEYDVPASAIRKITKYFKKELSFEELIIELKKFNFNKVKLIPYELNKIKSVIK